MIVQIRYYEIQIYPMKPSDVFRKRNLTKVNFEYEDLIGKDLSDSNLSGVNLEEKEIGISPGQACVFYKKDQVLGGGWII